jgi:phage terminase small subunit
MKLTMKQRLWCSEYLRDMNATQAAIRAGYSKNAARVIGHENLTKPNLMTFVKAEMDARAERTRVTADQVLLDLRDLADMCMSRKPIPNHHGEIDDALVVDKSGEVVPNEVAPPIYDYNPAAANKSLELLGKHLRLFSDVRVHEHTLADMTDAEIDEYEAELDRRLAAAEKIVTNH